MKIGFVGCGAIGSCYASILSKKHEVCVLDTYAPVIEAALSRDLKSDAEKIIAATVRRAELGFEQMTTTEGG